MTLMTKHLNCRIVGLVAILSDADCQTEKVFKRILTLACSAKQLNTSRRKIFIYKQKHVVRLSHTTQQSIYRGVARKKYD